MHCLKEGSLPTVGPRALGQYVQAHHRQPFCLFLQGLLQRASQTRSTISARASPNTTSAQTSKWTWPKSGSRPLRWTPLSHLQVQSPSLLKLVFISSKVTHMVHEGEDRPNMIKQQKQQEKGNTDCLLISVSYLSLIELSI